jgi:hypothetical protein
MYKLTDRRLDTAELILEEARASLIERGSINPYSFEHQLREIWNIGYQEIKDVMNDIVKRHPRFKFVAIYYMENSNPGGVVSEFKKTLASEYGLPSYDRNAIASLRERYWESARHAMQTA